MKNSFKAAYSNISFYSFIKIMLGLIIVLMPYGINTLPPALFITFFTWFIFLFTPETPILFKFQKFRYYLLPILATITTLSLLYSSDIYSGAKILERLISFLFFPFIFLAIQKKYNLNIYNIYMLLGIAIFISFIILVIRFESIIGSNELINHNTLASKILNLRQFISIHSLSIHRSYVSYLILIYISNALFSLAKHKKQTYIHIVIMFFSTLLLFILQSRAAIVTIFFLLFYVMFKLLFRKQFILFIILLSIIISGSFLTYKYTRLGDTFHHLSISSNSNKPDLRLIIWKNAINTIKQKPIFGYGVGDTLDELVKEHIRTGFTEGVQSKYDAHNQFLETWLQSGIFGLISLLLVFAIPLYQSIKKKQELLFLFLLVSFIQLLFESMFLRLAGVVYFSFFYSYLYYVYYAEDGEGSVNISNT